jgi:2-hydroxycyclohexanecarboxyl-CoA dehydrogenase
MNLELSGNGVVVVGGAMGIGKAIADTFREEGCQVGILDLQECDGGIVADVRDFKKVRAGVEHFREKFGRLDHAVYSTGMGSGKFGFPFWNLEPEDWGPVLEVNLTAAVNFAHVCAPLLREQSEGSMLFLTSVAGQNGSQTDPPYSAAKAGLINFMQCAAKDLAEFGIRVNALAPGMVKTAINQSVWKSLQNQCSDVEKQTYEEWAEEKINKIAPLGRWQTPEECAAMAVFLASKHARNITGQTLNVDGGQVMHS